MTMSTIPYKLKSEEQSPSHTKVDNLNNNNFRPVSILTSISKHSGFIDDAQLLKYFRYYLMIWLVHFVKITAVKHYL